MHWISDKLHPLLLRLLWQLSFVIFSLSYLL
jgi:hypothetical protein